MQFKYALLSLAALATACHSTSNDVQHGYGSDAPAHEMPDYESPEFMARMQTFMTPGPKHEELAEQAGHWNVATKMWMGPGTEPAMGNATADFKMILGGRYMSEDFHGNFMGQEFEGHLIMGYNNLTDRYESIWIDSMGTGITASEGEQSSDGTTEMSGMMRDMMTPEGRPFRMTHVRHSMNHFSEVMYDTLPDGTEWKVMEFEYTR